MKDIDPPPPPHAVQTRTYNFVWFLYHQMPKLFQCLLYVLIRVLVLWDFSGEHWHMPSDLQTA